MAKTDMLKNGDLIKEYRRLADLANKRLGRLEQAGYTKLGAYKSAMRTIGRRENIEPTITVKKGKTFEDYGEGKRFSTKGATRMSARELKKAINEIKERFTELETSTVGRSRELETQIRQKINAEYGLNLKSAQEVEALFDGALWERLIEEEKLGSKTALSIIASVQKERGDVKKALKKISEVNKTYISSSEQEQTAEIINEFISDKGLDFIFKGD